MMGMERWIDPRVGQVKPGDVMHYLLSRGWNRQSFPRREILVFEGPNDDMGKPIIQLLPASDKAPDYREALIRLITAVAIIEDRMAPAVLDDMLQQPKGAAAS